eukprot:scaffold17121_cov60-Attheya_sp.AAC.2
MGQPRKQEKMGKLWWSLLVLSFMLIMIPRRMQKLGAAYVVWSTSQVLQSIVAPVVYRLSGKSDEQFDKNLALFHGWNEWAWNSWEEEESSSPSSKIQSWTTGTRQVLDVPTLDMSPYCRRRRRLSDSLSRDGAYLVEEEEDCINITKDEVEKLLGRDWRRKPVLLKNLWSIEELKDSTRLLSFHGFQTHEILKDLNIPYFSNANQTGALRPNALATLAKLSREISSRKRSTAKMGSQLLVEAMPELILEVAPSDVVTNLWGNFFSPQHCRRYKAWWLSWIPPITTVPIFMAQQSPSPPTVPTINASTSHNSESNTNGICHGNHDDSCLEKRQQQHSRTDLHCEPIGNVAVQLQGSKVWTLVDPKYSMKLRPSISKHGRAYFYSAASIVEVTQQMPFYSVTTRAGDALWVPPWTWHRVDYVASDESSASPAASLAASLFHFRPLEFVQNNPIFAAIIIPNLFKEVFGINTE